MKGQSQQSSTEIVKQMHWLWINNSFDYSGFSVERESVSMRSCINRIIQCSTEITEAGFTPVHPPSIMCKCSGMFTV